MVHLCCSCAQAKHVLHDKHDSFLSSAEKGVKCMHAPLSGTDWRRESSSIAIWKGLLAWKGVNLAKLAKQLRKVAVGLTTGCRGNFWAASWNLGRGTGRGRGGGPLRDCRWSRSRRCHVALQSISPREDGLLRRAGRRQSRRRGRAGLRGTSGGAL